MKKVFVLLFTLSLIVLLASCNHFQPNPSDTTQPTPETNDPTAVRSSDGISDETDAPIPSTNVPEQRHIFEYDGVKYDLREISSLVNAVGEWGRIGKYVIADGHVNPNISVYAVINPETKTMEHHFAGSVPTYHSDDINTLVYAFWNSVKAYDGTVLAELTLNDGEFISSLSYTDDCSRIEVKIESEEKPRTEIIDLEPLDERIKHSYTSDIDNYVPENASSVPKVTILTTGKVILTYETDAELPLVYFGQVVDAETVRVTKTEFAAPDFEYTACEVIDYLYEGRHNVHATVRFTKIDGKQTDVYYYGCMTENVWEDSDPSYKWTVVSTEDVNALNAFLNSTHLLVGAVFVFLLLLFVFFCGILYSNEKPREKRVIRVSDEPL